MRLRTQSKLRNAGIPAILLAVASFGCSHVNNPWVDSSTVVLDDLTTASTEGYQGKSEFSSNRWRTNWEPHTVTFENGAVTHWPTWFEDPFEDKGNRTYDPTDRDAPDDVFAMNWVDYMHMLYGPGRFILNGGLWPVSAIVTPPGTLMESDGHLSPSIIGQYDHDAKRSDSVSREPPFVNYINDDTSRTATADTTETIKP